MSQILQTTIKVVTYVGSLQEEHKGRNLKTETQHFSFPLLHVLSHVGIHACN